jgi:hypothetical protein
MKRLIVSIAPLAALLFLTATAVTQSWSAEHPGSAVEHPGSAVKKTPPAAEHPGHPITADYVKNSIQMHVDAQAKAHGGVFLIKDDKLNQTWKLKLVKIHDPVRMFEKDGKTIYFACSDFKSTEGNDVLDIDFWMVPQGDKLTVTETRIHKLNGEPRYTYEGTTVKEVK